MIDFLQRCVYYIAKIGGFLSELPYILIHEEFKNNQLFVSWKEYRAGVESEEGKIYNNTRNVKKNSLSLQNTMNSVKNLKDFLQRCENHAIDSFYEDTHQLKLYFVGNENRALAFSAHHFSTVSSLFRDKLIGNNHITHKGEIFRLKLITHCSEYGIEHVIYEGEQVYNEIPETVYLPWVEGAEQYDE